MTFSTNSVPAPLWMFTSQMISGTNLVLGGVGHPGGTYSVVVSTNLASSPANWVRIATNRFDTVTGAFTFTNAIGSGQLFYRLQSP